MTTPISFESAKLLKEKGFLNGTLQWYHRYTKKLNTNDLVFSMNKLTDNYSAPTIADVVMWLYEKYEIWISVGGDCDYKFKFEINTWSWYKLEKCHRVGHTVLGDTFWETSSEPYNSPTEAYEAAIKHCLVKLV